MESVAEENPWADMGDGGEGGGEGGGGEGGGEGGGGEGGGEGGGGPVRMGGGGGGAGGRPRLEGSLPWAVLVAPRPSSWSCAVSAVSAQMPPRSHLMLSRDGLGEGGGGSGPMQGLEKEGLGGVGQIFCTAQQ